MLNTTVVTDSAAMARYNSIYVRECTKRFARPLVISLRVSVYIERLGLQTVRPDRVEHTKKLTEAQLAHCYLHLGYSVCPSRCIHVRSQTGPPLVETCG